MKHITKFYPTEPLRNDKAVADTAGSKYLSLITNMNQAFCLIEPVYDNSAKIYDYRIIETNPAFEKLTGFGDIRNHLVSEVEPDLGEEWFDKFGDVIRTGRPARFEGSAIHLSQKLWYAVSAFPAGDPPEVLIAVLFNNISAKKKIQDYFRRRLEEKVKQRTLELEESRDFIKRITETTPDIFYIINLEETKLTYICNAIRQYGYEPDLIYSLGTNVFSELLHPEDLEERLINIKNMASMKPEEVRESEFRIKDTSGKWHYIYNRSTIFRYRDNGEPFEILGIAQDITNKKLTENAYEKEKTRSAELKRMNEVMDTFVFAAAHDLKAPVSNLVMLTNIIEQTGEISLKLELQKKYRTIIEILNKTINGLVDVISIEKVKSSGAQVLVLENIYNSVTSELREKIKEANPEISTNFTACPEINYIEPYLISIFRNLISNALKYRHKSRSLKLDITSERSGRFCLLTFRDNGTGIDLDTYGNDLFKPFRRIDMSSEGTGIGLHLIKNIVTRNDGKIEVRSSPGAGTAFLIYLTEYNT